MNNIYPSNINKLLIHPSNRKLIASLRQNAYDTCRTKIGPQYIHTAFNNFKRGYYYTNDKAEILGFSIWKENNVLQKDDTLFKKLHIILICADYNDYKLGRKILFDIDSYSIDNKFLFITLQAANNILVKYYQHGGFILIDKDTREMKKEVKIIKIYKTSKTRKLKQEKVNSISLEEYNI